MRDPGPSPDRIARYRRGRLSEWVAAAALLARGYRILGRRVRTPHGEIDLIAVRGRRLAFVEVKRRATRAEAEAALSTRQAGRMARLGEPARGLPRARPRPRRHAGRARSAADPSTRCPARDGGDAALNLR